MKISKSETPKPGDRAFARVHNPVVASSRMAIAETARIAGAVGVAVSNLGDVGGEARMLARDHAQMALRLQREGKAALILSSGETTVTQCRAMGAGDGIPNICSRSLPLWMVLAASGRLPATPMGSMAQKTMQEPLSRRIVFAVLPRSD